MSALSEARVYNSNKATLDEVRVSALLACNKLEDCPPTSNAAKYHICRALNQACRLNNPDISNHQGDLPSPIDSGGYRMDGDSLVPIMMTLDPMADSVEEDVYCNCMTPCDTRRCPCRKSGNKCSLLCHKKLKYDHSSCMNWNDN